MLYIPVFSVTKWNEDTLEPNKENVNWVSLPWNQEAGSSPYRKERMRFTSDILILIQEIPQKKEE